MTLTEQVIGALLASTISDEQLRQRADEIIVIAEKLKPAAPQDNPQ